MFIFLYLFLWSLAGVYGGNAVLEGESVTLNPDLTEIQGNNEIEWTFGPTNILIIKLTDGEIRFYDHHADGRFKDRLKLDQTGSLTIMNTTTSDSGLYTVTRSSTTIKSFSLTVYARLPVPVISSQNSSQNSSSSLSTGSSSVSRCVFVCSVVNVGHVTLSWLKGNSSFSNISVSDLNRNISLHLKCLDDSYSCVVNNPISNQTAHLNTELCQPCPDSVSVVWISAAAGSLLIGAAVVIFCICRKHRKTHQKEAVQTHGGEITYADPTFYKRSRAPEPDTVVYAGVSRC